MTDDAEAARIAALTDEELDAELAAEGIDAAEIAAVGERLAVRLRAMVDAAKARRMEVT